jgi:subfamily B ATP-binding cassette protein MsbA
MHTSHTATLAITFHRVSYTYPLAKKPALSNFSLQVVTGETVALVGPSGSGKSTLLYLLAGFDTPSHGEICLFNRPIQNLSLDALRAQLAVVGQRVVLFDQTVRQNIALGQPHAMLPVEAWSPEQRGALEAAVEAAHAQDFIRQLPQGLDTPLGALGGRLSGGQRQRIAIARAFLKNAPILLLDEATSALDQESEQAVLRGLEQLMQGRTVMLISHAPERLLRVDRTVEMGPLE